MIQFRTTKYFYIGNIARFCTWIFSWKTGLTEVLVQRDSYSMDIGVGATRQKSGTRSTKYQYIILFLVPVGFSGRKLIRITL